jgi:hypothetical protein
MTKILSGIYDLLSISFVGGVLLFFVVELKIQLQSKLLEGSTKLENFTSKMTGSTLDLSNERIYGNKTLKLESNYKNN